jgi:hypothetical protein
MIIFRPSAINPSISLRDHTRFLGDTAGAIATWWLHAAQLKINFTPRTYDDDGCSASGAEENGVIVHSVVYCCCLFVPELQEMGYFFEVKSASTGIYPFLQEPLPTLVGVR